MTRATIYVKKPEELKKVYEMLESHEKLEMVKVKNKLGEGIQNVSLSMIFNKRIMSEIQLKCGSKSPNYNSNHFLFELIRCDSLFQFKQQVLLKLNKLAESNLIYLPTGD